MPEQKKTEEQLRHEIRRKFDFSEENDEERIDKALEMEKDRFKAVQKKQEIKAELEKFGKPDGKKDPEGTKGDSMSNYSIKDLRALQNVHDDDVDRVVKFAKLEGISIAEAKENSDMKAILRNRDEERKTAEAANTGGGKRGSSKISGKALLQKAEESGEIPESDAEMDKMLDERYRPST